MIQIDTSRCETLVKASVYAKANPSLVSDLEMEMLWDLNIRALGGDTLAECTLEEWAVIEQIVDHLQGDMLAAQVVPTRSSKFCHPALQIP